MGAFTLDNWNDIIRQVNDLAQNPPDGCDPVDTLEEAEAPHKWSKDDIQQVQDNLTEICKDNSFSDIPDLWKQDTIDEINDAISQGWCNCNNCDCSNARGTVETYCGVIEQTDCTEESSNCPGACQAATSAAGQAALQKIYQWADAWLAYCATRTKEALDLANSYEQEAEAKAQESLDQANQCSPVGVVLSFTSLLASTPWTDSECQESDSPCSDRDPRSCQAWWQIVTRTTYHSPYGDYQDTYWPTAMAGTYTRSGTPIVLSIPGCSGVGHYGCFSNGCGPAGCYGYTQTVEVKLIQEFPFPSDNGGGGGGPPNC